MVQFPHFFSNFSVFFLFLLSFYNFCFYLSFYYLYFVQFFFFLSFFLSFFPLSHLFIWSSFLTYPLLLVFNFLPYKNSLSGPFSFCFLRFLYYFHSFNFFTLSFLFQILLSSFLQILSLPFSELFWCFFLTHSLFFRPLFHLFFSFFHSFFARCFSLLLFFLNFRIHRSFFLSFFLFFFLYI